MMKQTLSFLSACLLGALLLLVPVAATAFPPGDVGDCGAACGDLEDLVIPTDFGGASPMPEPSAALQFGLGALLVGALRGRRRGR